jgi:hypothetical protein
MSTEPGSTPAPEEAKRKRSLLSAWTLMVVGVALVPAFGRLGGAAAFPLIYFGVLSYRKNAQPRGLGSWRWCSSASLPRSAPSTRGSSASCRSTDHQSEALTRAP